MHAHPYGIENLATRLFKAGIPVDGQFAVRGVHRGRLTMVFEGGLLKVEWEKGNV